MLGSRWVAEFFGSRFDTPRVSLMCRAFGSSRTREKEACDRVLSLPCFFHMVAELPGAATAKAMSRPVQEETGKVFEEANGGQSEASELMAGGPLPMASVAGGPVPFSQLFVPGGVQQTTPFVGGLQQVMPFLPVGGPMQSNSYVFGASMSPGGFAVPMSPAFGDARGGLVAGNDPVVTEVEPGSACAGRVQEPPETVEEINVDVPPERQEDGVRTPRKRQAEREVFIGTPERDPEPRSSRVRQVHSPSEVQGMPSMPSMPVGMRGSSSVPVGSPLINAPWISTQGGTTFGVTPEVWQQMQQQSVPQQPVRPQPDPLMMFMQQQSQQNALMMQQMMQMTTAVVQVGRSEWWWPTCRCEFWWSFFVWSWRRWKFNVVSG